jgi:outer membrane murein-binding lipoprotein Lpp
MSFKATATSCARCFPVNLFFSCLHMGCLFLIMSGCVSETKYEAVASEMDRLRADLLRAQAEVQALEEQRQALSKLNADGEKLLTGIRAELQQARIAYAEYRTEQNRIEGLKAKARALQTEHTKHMDDIKAAKRAERRMQAVIDRYEQEMGRVPDIGDMLRVSQAGEPGSSSHLVASIKPVLPDVPSPASHGTSNAVPISAGAPAERAVPDAPPAVTTGSASPSAPAGSIVSAASPVTAPVVAASTPKPASTTAPAAPKPSAQPIPANDSWLASVTGWLSSFWSWLFS